MKSISRLLFGAVALNLLVESISCASVSSHEILDFSGFQVLRITLPSRGHAEILEELKSQISIDEWRPPRPTTSTSFTTDLMIGSSDVQFATEFLNSKGLNFSVMIPNVGALIQEQKLQSIAYRSMLKASTHAYLDWADYYSYDQITAWVSELVANNSDIAKLTSIGKSTEGRDIQLVKISKPGSPADKNAVIIDGGFHAREWISPSVSTYILNEFLGPNKAANAEVLDLVDIYIIPIFNVDGYAYSYSTNRLWRKTRSDHGSEFDCRGVDPNRNFDFQFGGPGTSNDKCSEIYRGPAAHSEPETAALRDLLTDSAINFKAYLTIHSYSQLWLTPWSYAPALPEDYEDLMRFGQHGADALRAVHGTAYRVGATTEIYGLTAGCADDWAKAVAKSVDTR